MSRNADITLDWADGTYAFRMAWGQLAELQEKCDAGPYVVMERLFNNQWRIEDISSVIRLGLIGGGAKPADALRLVRAYVEDRPPAESVFVAQAVLAAGVLGAPDEDVGKKNETATGSTASPEEKSASPTSMEPAPSSA